MTQVRVLYFSDLLCVWAYVGQARLDELRAKFGDQVLLESHFCPVFGDIVGKIGARWADRGGLAGYGDHVQGLAKKYPHVKVHPELFKRNVPVSSMACHLFLAAVRTVARERALDDACQRASWALRQAFFVELEDVSALRFQLALAERLGLPVSDLERALESGRAHAELSRDYELARELQVSVSPTLVMDEGRQRLNGNVGYRVIEANVAELLREPTATQASWC